MSDTSDDKKGTKRKCFFKVVICFFAFCIISLGTFYLALVMHFSKWEDTEKITAMDRPAAGTLIENEFNSFKVIDFFETFQIELPQDDTSSFKKNFQDVMNSKRPGWFSALYRIRDAIVAPLGLKTSKKNFITNKKIDFKVGERFRTFKIKALADNEIVFGDEDKHLLFSCSISKSNKNGKNYLYFTTIVRYKNIWGPIYFFGVKPVHKLIVKTKLKKYVEKLYNG
ncbi:MAG: DUF2867 domain-containing protein [Desulfobacterales bacterium]|nr:DUF2867 domain-containing protein [Desulfobacterales bacterium]MCP4158653.1 DUF2867 domain-containing protein [Deltaproteobacteria bacterium]